MADLAHHIKALAPALEAMRALGFSAGDCLRGTGLSPDALEGTAPAPGFSLPQEYRFHRNLLQLTGDPLLGLRLGQAYTVENYGLLGYAFLSAPTLRQAMVIVQNYGLLSFTLFRIEFLVQGRSAILRFGNADRIPEDLLDFYSDRDLAAALHGGAVALGRPLELTAVHSTHRESRHRGAIEAHFGCPATLSCRTAELHLDAAVLEQPMPLRDAETSALCQQQCRLLLARLSGGGSYVDRVRELIVGRPGYFPDIAHVAERLNLSPRTLRRRLAEEDSSYQQILNEVRHQLAQEYLTTSTLPLEEIASLLGYSAPGNFTHAFKRWQACSPREFRREYR